MEKRYRHSLFKTTVIIVLLFGSIFIGSLRSFAQTDTPTSTSSTPTPTPQDNSSQIQDLQNKISQLQSKISDLQGQEKTFSSQITVMDSQIKLTEYQIESTKQQILSIEEDIDTAQKKIGSLQNALEDLTKLLLNRIVATYEVGSASQFQTLVASSNIQDFFRRVSYLRLVQEHDKKIVYIAVQAKNDYANQKQIFEDKKRKVVALQSQLESYTTQLEDDKQAKQKLLNETQGSEAVYQSLLSQAQTQLAGFSGFATSQGGASILTNQTVCDDWGCYYNQRDSQWGNVALNKTQYSIASDGCLLTSIAMMYTHYGHRDVTPLSVNSNPNNFASYYPAYLLFSISVNGVSSDRVGTVIDSTLAGGDPVIVGIRYGNGDTHFVVIRGGSGGNYMMNDPFTPNGNNIAFSSKYSLGSVFEVDKLVFQ